MTSEKMLKQTVTFFLVPRIREATLALNKEGEGYRMRKLKKIMSKKGSKNSQNLDFVLMI